MYEFEWKNEDLCPSDYWRSEFFETAEELLALPELNRWSSMPGFKKFVIDPMPPSYGHKYRRFIYAIFDDNSNYRVGGISYYKEGSYSDHRPIRKDELVKIERMWKDVNKNKFFPIPSNVAEYLEKEHYRTVQLHGL